MVEGLHIHNTEIHSIYFLWALMYIISAINGVHGSDVAVIFHDFRLDY